MIKRAKGPNKLSMREAVQLMQQEVRGQDEKVKLAIIGKGKLVFWDSFHFFILTECEHPQYHNETYYKPVTLLKNQIFRHFLRETL